MAAYPSALNSVQSAAQQLAPRERAYRGYVDAENADRAAFVALMLVRHHLAKAASTAAVATTVA
jgi:hypothetical protein